MVSGGLSLPAAHASHSQMWRSVPQTPALSTLMRTSDAPTVGTGTSRTSMPGPAAVFTMARIGGGNIGVITPPACASRSVESEGEDGATGSDGDALVAVVEPRHWRREDPRADVVLPKRRARPVVERHEGRPVAAEDQPAGRAHHAADHVTRR